MRPTSFASVALVVAFSAFGGCADHPYQGGGPAIDPNAPRVHITSPVRGTNAGNVTTVAVAGTATDDTGVDSVTVNGVGATLAADGSWTALVPVVAGTNLLHAIATDAQGNTGKESRAVVAGPMAPLGQAVPDSMAATISAQTFAAIARGASGFLMTGDLEPLIAPHNPVIDVGGGPDCLYAQGAITSISFGGAQVALTPQAGGLWLDAELDQVNIGMHLDYAAACIDGSRDITIAATHVSVSGNMTIGIASGQFDIHLDNPNVSITGLDLQLGGIPGAIVDLLSLDTAMGPLLGWATEKFVVPMLNTALAGLNSTKTVDAMGTPVDVTVRPSEITFSTGGAIVKIDTTLSAHGESGSFVYVPNTEPAMDLSQGFELAVADDAANQLLTSLQSAKGFDKTIQLATGSYGQVGQLYDSVELAAAVPPFVDATGPGLMLTVGDLVATFRNGSAVATAVAINAQVDVKVVTGADGALRFDVGNPTTYVDVLDDGVEGANELSNSSFEAITSFALSRIVAVGSGSLGAIPVPAFGGVAVTDLSIQAQTGYLVVGGKVQ